jgi:predicted  nucleic acid-binding Zn-ribbon protein
LKNAQQKLKTAEFAVKEQQIKIAQTESTLYGGKVRNPKELQDLQKDIASLKKHLAVLEDQQLEAMMNAEEKDAETNEAQRQLNLAQATFAEKSSGWSGQKTEFLRLLERLKAERTTATPPVQPEYMQTYDNIRKRKSGIAVTSARDGSCTVCGATIRPMELQAARTAQDLVFCTTCGRILYVG